MKDDVNELRRLAEFVSTLRYEDLSPKTRDLAKLAILNIIGGIIVADHPTLNPGRASLLRYAEGWGASPRATIIASKLKTAPELAALVNSGSAMMAHGDDWSWPAKTHLSSVVFPAALALTESEGLGGKDLITAYVAGWEVAARVGEAIRWSGRKIPFTSPVHSLATAGVTANLRRLPLDAALSALSIGCDMGTGLLAQGPYQHVVLRTPLGGCLGIYAGGIAEQGIEARPDILATFCQIYGEFDGSRIIDGLGERTLFEETGFLPKLFHFSTGIYPTIVGIQRYLAGTPIQTDGIGEISCEASPALRTVYGAPPAGPRETTHFSLRLAIGLALTDSQVRYADVAQVPNENPDVTRLAERVTLAPSKTHEDIVNLGVEAEVTRTIVTMRDGSTHEIDSVPYAPVTDPTADRERVEHVFMARVSSCWDHARASDLRDEIYRLDEIEDIEHLTRHLAN